MQMYLSSKGVLNKDYKDWVQNQSAAIPSFNQKEEKYI